MRQSRWQIGVESHTNSHASMITSPTFTGHKISRLQYSSVVTFNLYLANKRICLYQGGYVIKIYKICCCSPIAVCIKYAGLRRWQYEGFEPTPVKLFSQPWRSSHLTEPACVPAFQQPFNGTATWHSHFKRSILCRHLANLSDSCASNSVRRFPVARVTRP